MGEDDRGWTAVNDELKKRGMDLGGLLRDAHAGTALVLSSLLEDSFRFAFEVAMGHLSKHALKKLLEGYGPLSSFSARIDVAYGMHLITWEMRSDSNLIRGIRNRFAHSSKKLHFESSEIEEIGRNLSAFDKQKPDVLDAYIKAIDAITKGLHEKARHYMTAQSLSGTAKPS